MMSHCTTTHAKMNNVHVHVRRTMHISRVVFVHDVRLFRHLFAISLSKRHTVQLSLKVAWLFSGMP